MSAHQSAAAVFLPTAAPQSSPFQQMAAAVSQEIDAVRRRSRANILTVADGVQVAQGDGFTVYRFALRRGLALRDDTRADCELDGQTLEGTVLSARDGELLLSVGRDLGPVIRAGQLVLDNLWLLRALRERLLELAPREHTAALEAANRLLGRAPRRTGYIAPPPPAAFGSRRVLDEQQLAVGMALGSDFLLLWGPAGTGKSTTVGDITAALVRTDSILIVAHTNEAVDSALLKVVERLAGHRALADGQVLRFGPLVNDELRTRYGSLISFDAIVARRRVELGQRLSTLEGELAALEAEQRELDGALRRPEIGTPSALDAASRALMRERSGVVHARVHGLRAEVRALSARIRNIATEVMNGCRVMATTVHRAYLPRQVEREFDTVIIDEAGAVMLPMAVCAAARARRRVICAGDFRQLAAPVHASTEAARCWLARDVFTVAGVPQMVARGARPAHLVTLRTQFRMAADIAWLVNEPVYGGVLLTDASVLARPSGPLGRRGLIYVDTSMLRPRAVKRASGTRTNALHGFVVRALVQALERDGLLTRGTPPRDPDPVAVVTPYRGQIELIRRELARAPGTPRVEVATVHRFQGGERDIIIADLCDAAGPELGHFMMARGLEEESARLLNVMFTRARRHLVLVADFDYLLRAASADGLLRLFLERFLERGRRVDLKKLLGGPLADG